jgi:hypothetical protein
MPEYYNLDAVIRTSDYTNAQMTGTETVSEAK